MKKLNPNLMVKDVKETVYNFIRKGKASLKTISYGIIFALSGAFIASRVISLFD